MLGRSTFLVYSCFATIFGIAVAGSGFKWGNNACKHFIDYPLWFTSPYCTENPNVLSRMPDIITRSGYEFEEHVVTTRDKYLLSLFHLKSSEPNAGIIFLQNGYGSNPQIWVDKFNRSLAFVLNDLGYDVWIGNIRGSMYSGHETMSMDSQAFWDFTLDTVSQEDLPAMLDYVAEKCGQDNPIVYIGHGVATTLSYMYAASVPGGQQRLGGIVSMAPLGSPRDVFLIKILSPLYPLLKGFLDLIGLKVILYPESFWHLFLVNYCRIFPYVCLTGLQLFSGDDAKQTDPQDLLLIFSGVPSPYPTNMWLQYIQMFRSKEVTMFDYGSIDNQDIYQMSKPPAYDLNGIKIPVYLLYGRNDLLARPKDVQRLMASLGSESKTMIQISPDGKADYSHFDFKYGKNVMTQLYPVIYKAIITILEGATTSGGGSGQDGGDGNWGGNSGGSDGSSWGAGGDDTSESSDGSSWGEGGGSPGSGGDTSESSDGSSWGEGGGSPGSGDDTSESSDGSSWGAGGGTPGSGDDTSESSDGSIWGAGGGSPGNGEDTSESSDGSSWGAGGGSPGSGGDTSESSDGSIWGAGDGSAGSGGDTSESSDGSSWGAGGDSAGWGSAGSEGGSNGGDDGGSGDDSSGTEPGGSEGSGGASNEGDTGGGSDTNGGDSNGDDNGGGSDDSGGDDSNGDDNGGGSDASGAGSENSAGGQGGGDIETGGSLQEGTPGNHGDVSQQDDSQTTSAGAASDSGLNSLIDDALSGVNSGNGSSTNIGFNVENPDDDSKSTGGGSQEPTNGETTDDSIVFPDSGGSSSLFSSRYTKPNMRRRTRRG